MTNFSLYPPTIFVQFDISHTYKKELLLGHHVPISTNTAGLACNQRRKSFALVRSIRFSIYIYFLTFLRDFSIRYDMNKMWRSLVHFFSCHWYVYIYAVEHDHRTICRYFTVSNHRKISCDILIRYIHIEVSRRK